MNSFSSMSIIMSLILLIPILHSLLSKKTTKIAYSPSHIFIRFDFVQLVGSDVFGRVLDIEYDTVNSKRKYIVELYRAEDSPKVYPYYGRYRILYSDEIVGVTNIYGDF